MSEGIVTMYLACYGLLRFACCYFSLTPGTVCRKPTIYLNGFAREAGLLVAPSSPFLSLPHREVSVCFKVKFLTLTFPKHKAVCF